MWLVTPATCYNRNSCHKRLYSTHLLRVQRSRPPLSIIPTYTTRFRTFGVWVKKVCFPSLRFILVPADLLIYLRVPICSMLTASIFAQSRIRLSHAALSELEPHSKHPLFSKRIIDRKLTHSSLNVLNNV